MSFLKATNNNNGNIEYTLPNGTIMQKEDRFKLDDPVFYGYFYFANDMFCVSEVQGCVADLIMDIKHKFKGENINIYRAGIKL